MHRWRMVLSLALALLVLGLFNLGLGQLSAAPGLLEPGGLLIPLDDSQTDLRDAYREPLEHLYDGGRVHRIAQSEGLPAPAHPGDFYLPPGEVGGNFCSDCTKTELTGPEYIDQRFSLHPGKIAIFRSSVMVYDEPGEMPAMWEVAEIRQVLDGYLMGAVPYDVLTETQVAEGLEEYDLLIVPAFRSDARYDVLTTLYDSGASNAISTFVEQGGTLYAQGTGLLIAENAALLPEGTIDYYNLIELLPPDNFDNRGELDLLLPDSPLAYNWLTDTLYILDDPFVYVDEYSDIEVIAELTNADSWEPIPALFRAPYGAGQVIGVVGHPTDPTRRSQLPIFLDALLLALSGKADFYGDAIQTFNPTYPAHEFPAYEVVPVSATLRVENLWTDVLESAVITENVAPGYEFTGVASPIPTTVLTDTEGHTTLVWDLGALDYHADLTITYRMQTNPETLASGRRTFSEGSLSYTDLSGERITVHHRRFVLTARMAARLEGDRDLEADRHYGVPAEGVYLDVALPLENKEDTLAVSTLLTDWIYVLVPVVDYENQHEILGDLNGETVWMRNEPFLWDESYPAWAGATAPSQTITLDDWRALPDRPICVFTDTSAMTVTVPATYSDAISITASGDLLLPCYPLTWELGDLPGYWYEEPAVRFGVHSRELEGYAVEIGDSPVVTAPTRVISTPGSVYVVAGTDPVPYREYLDAGTPYVPTSPTAPRVTWQDVWSRTHEFPLRASFYDVVPLEDCASCCGSGGEGGPCECEITPEQHAASNVTFGLIADLDGDGLFETPVREIPTRLPETRLHFLGKTRSASAEPPGTVISPNLNLIDLPIFKGLGIRIVPENGDWWNSYRSVEPGGSTLVSVTEATAYDHLLFQQSVEPGASATFIVSATLDTYDGNREGSFKLHDGARLVYNQVAAGPNRYEIYNGHVHAAEGIASNGAVRKQGGPTSVSVYSDTLLFVYRAWDRYDPRPFNRFYDPFFKSWGYGDLVWSTYVGGREEKTLFHTTLGPGDETRVRVSLDNNTGITLTDVSVGLDLPASITATLLYTDLNAAPQPIWPELAYLNRTDVPDAWRSVWYFKLEVGDVAPELWGEVLDLPIVVSAGGLPAGYAAPPARLALKQPGAATPTFVSGPAHDLTLSDEFPADVQLNAAALVTDPEVIETLWTLLDQDAGDPDSDLAGDFFATLTPTVTYTISNGVVTFDLPEALRELPAAGPWYVVAYADLLRAQHGPNVVNAGPTIHYTDPFSLTWAEHGSRVTVEAHGAAVWVDYYCNSGAPTLAAAGPFHPMEQYGTCDIYDVPGEVYVDVTAYNAGDAVARGVTITLELPEGVTVTDATPPWNYLDGQFVTWLLGDLAPGAWRDFEIVMWVDPDEGEWYANPVSRDNPSAWMMGVEQTTGAFRDDHSRRLIRGQVAPTLWFNVHFTMKHLYLPTVLRGYSSEPDLLIEDLTVDTDDPQAVTIRVTNAGNSTARGFWVDLYFDPSAPPTVNTPWPELSELYGATWQIEALEAGESLELTIDDDLYESDYSRWPTEVYPKGEHEIWGFVDSWSDREWGWVHEADEGNNRFGPVTFTGTGDLKDLQRLPNVPQRPLAP